MLRFLLISFFSLLFSIHSQAQIAVIENFNTGVPGGWTNAGAVFNGTNAQSCTANSIRANVWGTGLSTTSTLTSANYEGESNGTDLNISFEYKIVNWSAGTVASPAGWGFFDVEYSTDGGASWVLLQTINDANHVTANTCATLSYVVAAADVPDGSDFQFRIFIDRQGGDFWFYVDSLSMLQTSDSAPNCDAVLTQPANGATNVPVATGLTWLPATGLATEYVVTVGTTPGGNDVTDNISVGLANMYNFGFNLAYETTHYVSILPSNINGIAVEDDCQEFSFTTLEDPSIIIDCDAEPLNTTFCYGDNENFTTLYTSSDGSNLNLTINSGNTENNWDFFRVFDSNGTLLATLTGNQLAGQTFQSSGDSISINFTSDGSVNCGSSTSIFPIDYTVSCATCANPTADFELVSDCDNAPQFLVEVNITDLGTATDLEITDNQGSPLQTANNATLLSFGPYPNGTDVVINVGNANDANCSINSPVITQELCSQNNVDCDEGPVNTAFCYGNNENFTLVYTSSDGSSLNLVINSGNTENNFDFFTVIDSDGTNLAVLTGNNLAGQEFQSSGDTISVLFISDSSVNCGSSANINPIDFDVFCATCTNPQVGFEVVSDCVNGPQFFVEVDITDIGSATSLDVSNNQNSDVESVDEVGILSFGPFANGTDVQITVANVDDVNCVVTSPELTQEVCTENFLDCTEPLEVTYCYGNNENTTFTYINTEGGLLNINVTAGFLETCCDTFTILDSDGTQLFQSGGNIGGNSFQSTGDELTVTIQSDFSVNCQGNNYEEIAYTVTCATCINPQVSFELIDDCESGEDQFFVEVDVADIGDADTLTVEDNQGNIETDIDTAQVLTFGPYANGTQVSFSVNNDQDANCFVNSPTLTQFACPPSNSSCDTAEVVIPNIGNLCETSVSGTLFEANASSVPSSCHNNISQDVWYEFTATSAVHMATVVNGTPFGAPLGMAIYQNDCGNLEELYCSAEFNNFGNSNSIVAEDLIQGETYFIRVYSFNQQNLNFDLCLTTPQFFEENELCEDIQPFCAPVDEEGNPTPLVFPNGYFYLNPTVAEDGPEYGCLFSQPNPAWFYLTVQDSGDLTFEISQSTAFNENGEVIGQLLDVDFIVYGPFDEVEGNCENLNGTTEVDCSFLPAAIETMTIPSAEQGEIYVVLITNFNQSPGYISLNQVNLGQDNSGSTSCDDVFGTVFGCASDGVVLTSEVEEEDTLFYQWFLVEEDENGVEEFIPLIDEDQRELTTYEEGRYFVLTQFESNLNFNEEFYTVRLSDEVLIDEILEQNLCDGETLLLDVAPINSDLYNTIEYVWFVNGEALENETTNLSEITETGNYSVTITTVQNINAVVMECVTTFDFSISGADFEIDLGEDQIICDADLLEQLEANLIGDFDGSEVITYEWSTGETTPIIQVGESGIYEVTVTVNGCSSSSSVEYIFNLSPEISLPSSIITCDLSETILDATPSNVDASEVTFEWFYESELLQDETIELLLTSTYGYGTYELIAYSGSEDCFTNQVVQVSSRDVSVIFETDSVDNIFCPGEFVKIDSFVEGVSGDAVEYTWFVNDNAVANTNGSFNFEIGSDDPAGSQRNSDIIRLQVNVGGDCIVSEEIELERYGLDNCIIPQGMSPDGVNHTLDLTFLATRTGIKKLQIFNRYGNRIFDKNNYVNEFVGQNMNGGNLVTGTYFIIVQFDDVDPVYGNQYKGWLYINRENN